MTKYNRIDTLIQLANCFDQIDDFQNSDRLSKFASDSIEKNKKKPFLIKTPNGDKFISTELISGFEDEMEHIQTVDQNVLKVLQIAMDHLREDPHYYSKMSKANIR